jgi:lipoate-protein ligase B
MRCELIDLGLIPCEEAWQLQADLVAQIAAGTHPASLLLLEHPHTFTFGRRGDIKNLLWNEEELAE